MRTVKMVLIVGILIASSTQAAYKNPQYIAASEQLRALAREETNNPGKYSMKEIKQRRHPYLEIVQQTYMLSSDQRYSARREAPNQSAQFVERVVVSKKTDKSSSKVKHQYLSKKRNHSSFQNVVKSTRPDSGGFKVKRSMFSSLTSKTKGENTKDL